MKKVVLLAVAALMMAACNNSKKEDASNADSTVNPAIENIMQRKSVRAYTDQKVSDDTLTVLIKSAMAAPSGMNVQPWHFVVLRDTSTYDEIFSKDNFNLDMYKSASAVVVLCADTTMADRDNPEQKVADRIWRDDMGACAENFLLAAESMGLGAVWTACYPYADRMTPVKKGLALPENVVPYCIIPVGYPAGDNQPKDKWKPERIHHDMW